MECEWWRESLGNCGGSDVPALCLRCFRFFTEFLRLFLTDLNLTRIFTLKLHRREIVKTFSWFPMFYFTNTCFHLASLLCIMRIFQCYCV